MKVFAFIKTLVVFLYAEKNKTIFAKNTQLFSLNYLNLAQTYLKDVYNDSPSTICKV